MRIPIALALAVVLIPALGLVGVGQAQAQVLSAVPIWGIVLGTIVVAGLLYLLVHSPDGGYYRYPYYGQYYQTYYRPQYRPYKGYYVESAPIIAVAPPIVGTVLGVVVVNNLQYVVTRDADGHMYRYPYYGPYRQVYYRPAYRPYRGDFANAPVRQGDERWDNDRRNLAPASQRPQQEWRPGPTYQQQQRPGPTYQQEQPNQQRQPNPGQNGGRNPEQRCGHQNEPACPKNQPHP